LLLPNEVVDVFNVLLSQLLDDVSVMDILSDESNSSSSLDSSEVVSNEFGELVEHSHVLLEPIGERIESILVKKTLSVEAPIKR